MNTFAMQLFLASTELCRGLPSESLAQLAQDAQLIELQNGELLIKQGEVGDCLYLVIDGRLEAQLQTDDSPPRIVSLARIGPGESVGELAVLSNDTRACNVVAIRDTRVAKLMRDACLALVTKFPQAWFRIAQQIVRRSQEKSRPAAEHSQIALIPTGTGAHLSAFAESLVDALSEFGPTALVRENSLKAPAGSDSFIGDLTRRVQKHERSVQLGEGRSTRWDRRTVRQADLILVVANLEEDPALSEFESTALFNSRPMSTAQVELVLLRPDRATPPKNTARWLQSRRVHRHHHVALNSPADVQRLARIISGNAINLVFSGGGARGFAHIGVLRAMLEAGIPIDQVGGTSMGAGIAAFQAMGVPTERMLHGIQRHLGGIRDFTLPIWSIFAGRGWTRALQAVCGDILIEDLCIPFFAVSADLQKAVEHVHRRGPLWRAIRATTSIPGIYPPVLQEDSCLVDGGVLNNFPIDVMAAMGAGRIVGVDVSQEFGLTFPTRHDVAVSGWRLLWRRLNPFRRTTHEPNIADLLVRSAEIAAVRIGRNSRENTKLALHIVPPVTHFRTMEFSALDAIVEAGYRYASTHVEAWKQTLAGKSQRSLQ